MSVEGLDYPLGLTIHGVLVNLNGSLDINEDLSGDMQMEVSYYGGDESAVEIDAWSVEASATENDEYSLLMNPRTDDSLNGFSFDCQIETSDLTCDGENTEGEGVGMNWVVAN